jgi:hypothetical protein
MNKTRKISFVVTCFITTLFLMNGIVSAADKVVVIPLFGDEGAPVAKTGQSTSYATGDDGELKKGVAWPTPRFKDNGNGTVTDKLTGLIWLKNANCFGQRTWYGALGYCNTLEAGYCGLNDGSSEGDWRLPNVKELHSLIDFGEYPLALPSGHPFTNVQSSYYWSSTTIAHSTGGAWLVNFSYGYVGTYTKSDTYYVLAVRGGN